MSENFHQKQAMPDREKEEEDGQKTETIDIRIIEKAHPALLAELCTEKYSQLMDEKSFYTLLSRIGELRDEGGLEAVKNLAGNSLLPEPHLGFLAEGVFEDLKKFKKREETMYITAAFGWRAFEDVLKNIARNPTAPEESLRKIAEIDFEGGGVIAEEIRQAATESIRIKSGVM